MQWEKNVGGVFILNPGTPNERRVKNTIVGEGAVAMLKKLWRNENTMPANTYLGVTNADYTYLAAALADIEDGEPVGNGYARQVLVRDTNDWNVPELENDIYRIQSKAVQFTATTAWDKTWTRLFLCSVASGAGFVYGLSGLIDEQTVLAGQGPLVAYEFWMRP